VARGGEARSIDDRHPADAACDHGWSMRRSGDLCAHLSRSLAKPHEHAEVESAIARYPVTPPVTVEALLHKKSDPFCDDLCPARKALSDDARGRRC
jgi:hypothetical protein